MKNLKMQNHWYLGVLGVIGLWTFPDVWRVITGQSGDYTDLANLLWFAWFLYLLPEDRDEAGR